MPPNWFDRKISFIESLDEILDKRINSLQRKFYIAIRDHFEQELVINDKNIKTFSKNYGAVVKLDLVSKQFRKDTVNPFLSWAANQYIKLLSFNRNSIASDFDNKGAKIHADVRSQMLRRIGILETTSKTSIQAGGWLHSVGNIESQYLRVKEIAINAIADGIPFENLRRQLKAEIITPSQRGLKFRFERVLTDSFAGFDRGVTRNYGDRLGVRAYRYSGGLIESSRDFCIERNGKIFTIEEIEKWKDDPWIKDNLIYYPNYDPLVHMGLFRCRHTPRPLSKQRAIRGRPELKVYYEQFDKAA